MPWKIATGVQRILVLACVACALVTSAWAADRASVEAFLKTTGFDVAIDSIALSAENAPDMLGLEEDAFGYEWKRIADQVFQPSLMRERAIGILEQALENDALIHAAGFYASDLGQRLVEAENRAHLADDVLKQEQGEAILAELENRDGTRVETFRRMNHAIDPNDIGTQAVQEIQIRFILAASYAGIIQLRVDEDGLRAAVAENSAELRQAMEEFALVNAAYTYRDFSDDDLLAYAEALEHPVMAMVYELMNAVHFEVMMNRFEVLARRLGQVGTAEEL